jgi:peptidoglycan hydrolase CwlO-like protein
MALRRTLPRRGVRWDLIPKDQIASLYERLHNLDPLVGHLNDQETDVQSNLAKLGAEVDRLTEQIQGRISYLRQFDREVVTAAWGDIQEMIQRLEAIGGVVSREELSLESDSTATSES